MGQTARILVVDDDADLSQALGDRLRALGLQVTLTGSGTDALRLVREEGPAVVLLDLVLPGMDGMAVLDAIRREASRHGGHRPHRLRHDRPRRRGDEEGRLRLRDEAVRSQHLEIVVGKALERQAPAGCQQPARVGDRRPLRRDRREQPVDAGSARGRSPGRPQRGHRAAARRERHRQGGARARPPPAEPRGRAAVRRVNCAALSERLLETELFGHEKGAFTGAHQRKRGRSSSRTAAPCFLDEIGEHPAGAPGEAPARPPGRRRFERVGGTRADPDRRPRSSPRPTATSTRRSGAGGSARTSTTGSTSSRVTLPAAARARRDDIPPLARHFLDRYRRASVKRDLTAHHGRGAWRGSGATPGPATCASWRTRSSARSSSPTVPRSACATCRPRCGRRGWRSGLIRDSARSFHASVEEYKRGLIVSALRRAGGNRTHAARMLGLQRTYLSRIIRDLGLGPADETESEAPAAAGPLAIASE